MITVIGVIVISLIILLFSYAKKATTFRQPIRKKNDADKNDGDGDGDGDVI